MDKVIHLDYILNCSVKKAFELFTQNNHLENWLAPKTDVEPEVGGKYELFWNLDNKEEDSTLGCKVLAIKQDKLLCFEWKGASMYAHFMNNVRPLTNVTIAFTQAEQNKTEINFLHTGWRDTDEWEEARIGFEKIWKGAFHHLKHYIK